MFPTLSMISLISLILKSMLWNSVWWNQAVITQPFIRLFVAHYQLLFANFDAKQVAGFSDERLEEILLDPGIVRNRLKVFGVRTNALAFLKVVEEFGSFDAYIWGFVGGKQIQNHVASMRDVPAKTSVSDAMSKDLKRRGFKFIGSTICYAFMQAVGMVDDHMVDCSFRAAD